MEPKILSKSLAVRLDAVAKSNPQLTPKLTVFVAWLQSLTADERAVIHGLMEPLDVEDTAKWLDSQAMLDLVAPDVPKDGDSLALQAYRRMKRSA